MRVQSKATRAPRRLVLLQHDATTTSADWAPTGALREGVDPTNPAMALEVNAVALDGRLSATLAWPAGILSEPEVAELAGLWRTALESLARCADLAGHTPSDFPLVSLTQADVDTLTRREGGAEDILPLLPLQEGMYVHTAMAAPGEDSYVTQQVAELSGPVDPASLRRAVEATVRRHEALRAGFAELADGRVVQVIAESVELPWREVPCQEVPGQEVSGPGDLDEILAAELAELADQTGRLGLARPPLLRYALVSLSPTDHRLVETMHHVLADGWSYPLMFNDIVAAYRAGTDLPTPAVTYRDHVEAVCRQDRDRARAVWARALAGVVPTLLYGEQRQPGARHDSVHRALPAGLTSALAAAARAHGVTLSTFLHGAWGLLLGRLLGRDEVVFGSTVSGRGGDLSGVESVVGLLINTIPVPMAWRPGEPVGDVLTRLHRTQADVLDVQHVGLAELARVAGVREFFDTMVVVENFPPVGDDAGPGGLAVRGFTGTDSPHYPVALVAFPGERLTLEIKYDVRLVGEQAAGALLDQVVLMIGQLADGLDRPVAALDVVPTGAIAGGPVVGELVRAGAGTLAEPFGHAAPSAVAVSYGDQRLTYAELEARANRLARELIDRGVRPESRVAVALPRGGGPGGGAAGGDPGRRLLRAAGHRRAGGPAGVHPGRLGTGLPADRRCDRGPAARRIDPGAAAGRTAARAPGEPRAPREPGAPGGAGDRTRPDRRQRRLRHLHLRLDRAAQGRRRSPTATC